MEEEVGDKFLTANSKNLKPPLFSVTDIAHLL